MSRDTQFQGFAKVVIREMLAQRQGEWIDFNSDNEEEIEEYSKLLAQRAYDLVYHAFDCTEIDPLGASTEQLVSSIPDLTEFPLPLPVGMTEEEANRVLLPSNRKPQRSGPHPFEFAPEFDKNNPIFCSPQNDLDKRLEDETKQ